MNTDRIEKRVVLEAPRARVWQAITDPEQFGAWFGARLAGRFTPGEWIHGKITTPGYDHLDMDMKVEKMEPQRLFSFWWHPYEIEAGVDHDAAPRTHVEFRLDEVPEGVAVTIVESGFDRLPASRRDEAYRSNDGGWQAQTRNLERHVSGA